jgi:glycerol uptake facilitator-like aquaporin
MARIAAFNMATEGAAGGQNDMTSIPYSNAPIACDPCAKKARMKREKMATMHVTVRDDVGNLESIAAEINGTYIFAIAAIGGSIAVGRIAVQAAALPLAPPMAAALSLIISLLALIIVAFAHTFGLFVAAASFGHLSAHINGAVTVAFMLLGFTGRKGGISVWRGIMLLGGQAVGWLAAAATFLLIHDTSTIELGRPLGGAGFSDFSVACCEILGTFVLTLVILMHDAKPDQNAAVGWALGICIFVFKGPSGASLNPWRWFAPSLISLTFTSRDWIWALMPFVGAILAVVMYTSIFSAKKKGCKKRYQQHYNMVPQC